MMLMMILSSDANEILDAAIYDENSIAFISINSLLIMNQPINLHQSWT